MTTVAALQSKSNIWLVHTGDLSSVSKQKPNSIVDADSGETLAEWRGSGIEAATMCDDTAVCACLDGLIYLVRGQEIQQVQLENKDIWPTHGIELSPGVALFVGQKGKLIFVDIQSQTARTGSLSDWDIPKPGRDILSAVAVSPDKCYLLGNRELIVLYDANRCEVLSSSRSEIRFSSCVEHAGALWITAKDGLTNSIACYDGQLSYHESPIPPAPYTPSIAACDTGILVGLQKVFVGSPGNWREIGDVGEPAIIQLIPRTIMLSPLLMRAASTGFRSPEPLNCKPTGRQF